MYPCILPFLLLSLTTFGSPFKTTATDFIGWPASQNALRDTTLIPSQKDSVVAPTEALTPPPPQIVLNTQAAQYVDHYIKKEDYTLQKVKQRSDPYFKLIESIFKKYELPVQLKYLAVVESELKRTSVSHMGAAGPWQLMPVTARELGLKITAKNDERTHYYKSTTAAAKYLKRLYTLFDDWLLVIAAYNSGPGTVYKAIKKSGSRNFWQLQHHLPTETRLHVKRFIGVHYFFEEEGSETVLTKNERVKFEERLQAYYLSLAPHDENEWTQITLHHNKDLSEASLKLLLPAK